MYYVYYIAFIGLLLIITKKKYVNEKVIELDGIRFKVRFTGYKLLFGLFHKVYKVEIISSNLILDINL